MLALDFLDPPCCGEPDDLVEGGGECPHVVDPWSAEDHIVGRGAVEHNEGDMEVDFGCVDWGVMSPNVNSCSLLNSIMTVERRWM